LHHLSLILAVKTLLTYSKLRESNFNEDSDSKMKKSPDMILVRRFHVTFDVKLLAVNGFMIPARTRGLKLGLFENPSLPNEGVSWHWAFQNRHTARRPDLRVEEKDDLMAVISSLSDCRYRVAVARICQKSSLNGIEYCTPEQVKLASSIIKIKLNNQKLKRMFSDELENLAQKRVIGELVLIHCQSISDLIRKSKYRMPFMRWQYVLLDSSSQELTHSRVSIDRQARAVVTEVFLGLDQTVDKEGDLFVTHKSELACIPQWWLSTAPGSPMEKVSLPELLPGSIVQFSLGKLPFQNGFWSCWMRAT
ncbi:hypothetical protein KCU65_g352, partial [Aureobasidium melanogenum]